MTSDDRGRSLADQAASWVPPWERVKAAEAPAAAPEAPLDEPAAGEPASVDPAPAEPVPDEPASAGPGSADPELAGPAPAESVLAEPASPEPVLGEPTSADPELAGPASADPELNEPASPKPVLDELAPAEPVLDGTPGGEAAADEVALGEAAAAAQEGPPDEAAPDEALPAPSENAVPERAGAAPNVAFSLDEAPESASGEEADGAEDAHGADDASAETRDASAQTRADEAAQPLAGAPDAQPLGGAPDVQPSAAAPDSQPEVPPGEAPSFDAALADAVLPEAVPEEGEPEQQSPEPLALIGEAELRGALEAILLVVEEPVSEVTLAQALEQPVERVTGLLGALAKEYESTGRGFELRQAAGGWRLYTRPEYAQYVERFVLDGQQLRLTQAALETLAVVAYKQPVTRSRISAIRGVNCDGVIRTLISRGLVEECGTEPDSGAFLYRTTNLFLEKLGLNSVDELPPLAPFLPDDVDEITDAPS